MSWEVGVLRRVEIWDNSSKLELTMPETRSAKYCRSQLRILRNLTLKNSKISRL